MKHHHSKENSKLFADCSIRMLFQALVGAAEAFKRNFQQQVR